MARRLSFFAIFALALAFCAPSHGQDTPSLGDLAKQAQKDKANKPPAKVITNDDVPSGSKGTSPPAGAAPGAAAQAGTPGKLDATESPEAGLEQLQSQIDQLAGLDRASLAAKVLDGNTSDFPGRAKWEEKLFSAKQTFVSQNRDVLESVKQLLAAAGSMKDVQDQNDPRAKNMAAKLQQLVDETKQNAATFQAVMEEGEELATRAGAH